MSVAEIVVFILSMLFVGVIFVIKSKKHANDTRIRRWEDRRPPE